MEPDMVLLWERSSRSSKLVSTPNTSLHSAAKPVWRDKPQASGNAKEPERRWPVVLISSPPPLPSLPKLLFNVSRDWEKKANWKTERNEGMNRTIQHMCYTEQTGSIYQLAYASRPFAWSIAPQIYLKSVLKRDDWAVLSRNGSLDL